MCSLVPKRFKVSASPSPPPPDPALTLILTECTKKIQQIRTAAIDVNKKLYEFNKLPATISKSSFAKREKKLHIKSLLSLFRYLTMTFQNISQVHGMFKKREYRLFCKVLAVFDGFDFRYSI